MLIGLLITHSQTFINAGSELKESMMPLQELIEIESIKQLKFRYLRAVDTHDWPLMETLFADDATVWLGGGKYSHSGIADIMNFFKTLVTPSMISSHIAVHPEIEIKGPSEASGIWRLVDSVFFLEGNAAVGAGIEGGEALSGAGYYYDDYVKTTGGWKIQTTGYVRIYETIEPGALNNQRFTADPKLGKR
jgi:SnoaL-like domain